MLINKIYSSDTRFKSIRLHEGLNILVADRTESSVQGDSRNSIGKTSFVKVIKYLLGGDLPDDFKKPELSDHTFLADISPGIAESGALFPASISRPVSPTTKLRVQGWNYPQKSELQIDKWREALGRELFQLSPDISRPTVGQLWGQLIRTSFGKPTKVHPSEPDWESGVRIGYFLGLSPEILGKAGEIEKISKQGKAVRAAIKDGAISHLSLDEPELRAQVAASRLRRDRARDSLRSFRVDEQYSEHQEAADQITSEIQNLNDEALSLERRARELTEVLAETSLPERNDLSNRLSQLYEDLGIVLPDSIVRRYEEVSEFHKSIVRNRRLYLQQELDAAKTRLREIENERHNLDSRRSRIMILLNERVALDTFLDAQRSLAELEAETANLENRLKAAESISEISTNVKLRTAELASLVRSDMKDQSSSLERSISLFSELGAEIYSGREVSLLVSSSQNGLLSVIPQVSGDSSSGVRSVETFMLDIVCLISALRMGRAPRILVHDSELFDSIDGRQAASCLNIGARLAEEFGFQYIVTMNSDFLESIELESGGAFDSTRYVLPTRLTDASDDGGLFGFRFD